MKYVGHQISSRYSDCLVLCINFTKARKRLSQISTLNARKGADPVVWVKIYAAPFLAVLLYNLESWVWFSRLHGSLCACWRLADKKPKRQYNDTFKYCRADKAMEVWKLCQIQLYIARRRQTLLAYNEKRAIYKLCREVIRGPRTPSRTHFWLEQDLSHWIDFVKYGCPEARVINDAGV